jgi:TetR/AcrR family transcriptional repressor of nem operon
MADTRQEILATARVVVQKKGYGGLSFRDLASATGIKSASVHYYFPTKADLGAELARCYTEQAQQDLDAIAAATTSCGERLRRYAALFRKALADENRMCLCGMLAAEFDSLPKPVRAEVSAFADVNIKWLTRVLADAGMAGGRNALNRWASSIYAAISGAQLLARGRGDIKVFDEAVEFYRKGGLIPRTEKRAS